MRHSVFVGALEATAKIAGCAALVGSMGCSPNNTEKGADTGVDNSDSAIDPVDSGVSVVVGDPDVDDDGDLYTENNGDCNDGDSSAYPGGSGDDCGLSTCQSNVSATFSEADPLPDTETEACCQLIANYYDQNYDALMEWEERDQCCELLGWQNSMACTPWGPPTPPEMPQARKEMA